MFWHVWAYHVSYTFTDFVKVAIIYSVVHSSLELCMAVFTILGLSHSVVAMGYPMSYNYLLIVTVIGYCPIVVNYGVRLDFTNSLGRR